MKKRKNYFIKKKFQFSFAAKFVFLAILESFLIVGLFMNISYNTLTTGYQNSTLRVESTQNFFLVPFILITLIVVIGISLIAFVVFTLLSHRIAGPLYRFEQVLKQIREGDLTTSINLRKADQLIEMKKELTNFVNALDSRIGHIKSDVREVQKLLAQTNNPDAVSKICKHIDHIQKEINHYKVTSDTQNG